jgi:sec-independent protein translocase protein TatB
MFDIGWTEMLVIAIVMIVVVGPKDLPRMLRTFGKTTAKLRSMAGDFQKQFNEALKEAELDDVKKSVDQLRSLDPRNEIKKQLNPFEKAAQDVRAGLNSLNPSVTKPAEPAAHAAEPLKNGATEMPGVNGPTAMPETPVFPAKAQEPAVSAGPAVSGTEQTAAPAGAARPAPKAAASNAAAKPKASAKVAPAKPAAKAPTKSAAKPKAAGKNKTGTLS